MFFVFLSFFPLIIISILFVLILIHFLKDFLNLAITLLRIRRFSY